MSIEKGEFVTSYEMDQLLEESKHVKFNSSHGFLREHNGYRNGKLHLFIGTASSGKSTLVRSLILDAVSGLEKGKKILVWLSEETNAEFNTELAKSGIMQFGQAVRKRIDSFSEQGSDMSQREYAQQLEDLVTSGEYDIVIVDNITTSSFYDGFKPDAQNSIAKKIKKIFQHAEIPCVLIAHTTSQISDSIQRLIEPEDIRGSRGIVNLVEFCYVIQKFTQDKFILQTLRICKHRGQDVNDRFFFLKYDKQLAIFKESYPIDFARVSEIYKNRNKLGK